MKIIPEFDGNDVFGEKKEILRRSTKHSMDRNLILKVSGSTIHYFKASAFAMIPACSFLVMFFVWSALSLGDTLVVCGSGQIDCTCTLNQGLMWSIRSILMIAVPYAVFSFCPFHYYQDLGLKFVAYSGFVFVVTTGVAMLLFRNSTPGAQYFVFTLLALLMYNCGYAYVGGMESIKRNQLITVLGIWLLIVTTGEAALSYINPKLYSIILPFYTLFIDLLWFVLATNGTERADIMSSILIWAIVLGIISGVNFSAYLTAQEWTDYLTVSVINCVIEICIKLYPCWIASRGQDLHSGHVLYSRLVSYVEYIPAVAYSILVITGVSPLGQMVESTVDGCSGSPTVREYKMRWFAVVILIFAEIFSDYVSFTIAQRLWNAGYVVQPLQLENPIQYILFFGSALLGCCAAIECCAIVFKASVRGGIV